jgi:transcription elongation factor Elf1
MTLQSATLVPAERPFGFRSCPHCDQFVVAPEASEFAGNGKIRHVWSCDSCGHEFETAVRLTAEPIC